MLVETSRGTQGAPLNEALRAHASAIATTLDAADAPRREALWLPLALGTAIASALIISAAVWVAEPLPVDAAAAPVAVTPVATTATRAPGG